MKPNAFYKKLNSIRGQIAIAFFSLIVIIIGLQLLAYSRVKKLPAINTISEIFTTLQKEQLFLKSVANDFILNEISNEAFFKTGESIPLKKYKESLNKIKIQLIDFKKHTQNSDIHHAKEIITLKNAIARYDFIFRSMVSSIKKRGYGKYGLIGEFDKAIMDLIRHDFGVDNVAVLNLQLYVKDYLLTGNQGATKDVSNEIYFH